MNEKENVLEEFPEGPGYENLPGFVKSNPLNNKSYIAKWCEAYSVFKKLLPQVDADLEAVIPGYNIDQIKIKFNGLRYYISYPEGTTEEQCTKANAIITKAEYDYVILDEEDRKTS